MTNQIDLQKATVRILVDNTFTGTGVCFYKNETDSILCIATAKHCIYGEEFDKVIIEDDVIIQFKDVSNEINIPVYYMIPSDDNDDLSILVCKIKDTKLEGIEIPNICNLKKHISLGDKLDFFGYPSVTHNERALKIETNLTYINENTFDLQSTSSLDTFYSSAEQNTKGFSGSGVFSMHQGNLTLVGIVQEFSDYNTLHCKCLLPLVEELLKKENIEFQTPSEKKSKIQTSDEDSPYPPFLLSNDEDIKRLQENLFPDIAKGNCILFIGPNALINDDKKFIQDQLIKYCCQHHGLDYDDFEGDSIFDFVDTIKEQDFFTNAKFNNLVFEFYNKFDITNTYQFIPNVLWRAIITTSSDLLIETAYDKAGNRQQTLRMICDSDSYHSMIAQDETKYVKLFGSLHDLGKNPPILSSKQIKNNKVFLSTVSSSFKNPSHKTPILLVGFSNKDKFSKKILTVLKKHKFFQGWIYTVDPHVNPIKIKKLQSDRICVVNTSIDIFFNIYQNWFKNQNPKKLINSNSFEKKNNRTVKLKSSDFYLLGKNIIQLNNQYKANVTPKLFLEGMEVAYNIITNQHDVIREKPLNQVLSHIRSIDNTSSQVIPIVLLTGQYGSGKSTFCLRLIHQLVTNSSISYLAFEIKGIEKVNIKALKRLFNKAQAENYILYIDNIEQDSVFKNLFILQNQLTSNQSLEYNVIILSSIRDNILQRFNKGKRYSDFIQEINIDSPITKKEATQLIDKLYTEGFNVNISEKDQIVYDVVNRYGGDILTSLQYILPTEYRQKTIRGAFNQLTSLTKKAFLITSLLYRFKILMPSNLLKDVLAVSWDEFTNRVIKVDGKNILIQEDNVNVKGLEPDLYFKTRHSLISDKIIELYYRQRDKKFREYQKIFNHLQNNRTHSIIAINLLKALSRENDLNEIQIRKLYDKAAKIFEDNQHYVINYSMNLQSRKTEKDLIMARDMLMHVQNNDNYYNSNHYVIHRRGVVSFSLAKFYYSKQKTLQMESHIEEARDFFDRKLSLDPHSSYSYYNYLQMLIWELRKLQYTSGEKLNVQSEIEILIDQAENSILGKQSIAKIKEIELEYRKEFSLNPTKEYLEELNYKIENAHPDSLSHLLILKFFYFKSLKDNLGMHKLIEELEEYKHLDMVANVLFKYYGRKLHFDTFRKKYFDLINLCSSLEEQDPLRFLYYNYVARAYNKQFQSAFRYQKEIREKYSIRKSLNPILSEIWKDENENTVTFEGKVMKSRHRDRKIIRIQDFFLECRIYKNKNRLPTKMNDDVKVKLHFFVTGIMAEVVEIIV